MINALLPFDAFEASGRSFPLYLALLVLLFAMGAAALLGVSHSGVANSRLRGDGPLFVKIGRAVRYPRLSLLDYIKSRTRISTSER